MIVMTDHDKFTTRLIGFGLAKKTHIAQHSRQGYHVRDFSPSSYDERQVQIAGHQSARRMLDTYAARPPAAVSHLGRQPGTGAVGKSGRFLE